MNLFNKGAVISGFYLLRERGSRKILSTAIQKDLCRGRGAYTSTSHSCSDIFWMVTTIICLISHLLLHFTAPAGTAYCFGTGKHRHLSGNVWCWRNSLSGISGSTAGQDQRSADKLYRTLGFTAGKILFNPADAMPGVHLSSIGTILYRPLDTSMTVSGYISVDPTPAFIVDHP